MTGFVKSVSTHFQAEVAGYHSSYTCYFIHMGISQQFTGGLKLD